MIKFEKNVHLKIVLIFVTWPSNVLLSPEASHPETEMYTKYNLNSKLIFAFGMIRMALILFLFI